MNIKHLLSAIATLLLSASAFAQTVSISDGGTITLDCDQGIIVTDSEANGGNYGPNENNAITVCPGAGYNGVVISVDLVEEIWDVDGSDLVTIFDGNNTSAPVLGSYNSVSDNQGFTTQTTQSNTSGCMTIQFVSDDAGEGAGFTLELDCQLVFQQFTAAIVSNPPALPTSTDYVDICPGETVEFYAACSFPNSGNSYLQNPENCNFLWEFGQGSSVQGIGLDTVSFQYTDIAGFNVYLTVTDILGFPIFTTSRVRVSTTPIFAGTYTESDTLCIGESTIIHGAAAPVMGTFFNGGSFGESVFLPDGSGVSYQTSVMITGFPPGQTIQNVTDVTDICLNMEHSYLGDLMISITCPNGQSAILKQYPGGGGTYLGGPVDNDGTPNVAGVGATYCFSMGATWGTMLQENTAGNFVTAGTPPNNSLSPGTFTPFQTFDNLLGCPINGPWTITVTDNLASDNGNIFEWSVAFDPSINPAIETYTPVLISQGWLPNPTITATNGNDITVVPTQAGNINYTFSVTDDFGCTYDTLITVHVVPNLTSFADDQTCGLTFDLEAAVLPILGQWSSSGPGTVSFSPDNLNQAPTATVSAPGLYTFIYQSDYCGQRDTMEVFFRLIPQSPTFNDTIICPGASLTFDALNAEVGPNYNWTPDSSSSQTLTLDNIQQNTQVTVSVENECGTATETANVTVNEIDLVTSLEVCLGTEAGLVANNVLTGGTWTATGPGTVSFNPSATATTTNASATVEGNYTFVFTDNYCNRTPDRQVTYAPIPSVSIFADTNRICWENELLFVATTNTDFLEEFNWSPSNVEGDSLLIIGSNNALYNINGTDSTQVSVSVTVSNFCGTDTKTFDFEVIDCTLIIPNIFNPNSTVENNRAFHIDALDLHPGNHVVIYDRWGLLTYEADNYHLNEWNGDGASDGVYYYIVTRPGYEAQTGYVHLVGGGAQ